MTERELLKQKREMKWNRVCRILDLYQRAVKDYMEVDKEYTKRTGMK